MIMDRAKLKETFSWKHRWVRWGVGFVVWTLLGLSFAVRSGLSALQSNLNISWKAMITAYLTDFYLWGLVSPLIFKLARRFELLRRIPRNLLIHLGLSAVPRWYDTAVVCWHFAIWPPRSSLWVLYGALRLAFYFHTQPDTY
jgi:hypothetical protein